MSIRLPVRHLKVPSPAWLEGDAPLALVGLMGAGKTTVGRRIAKALALDFVDSDHEIEARCGVSIATIFDLEGEAGFRRREQNVIEDLMKGPRRVVATGGGAVLAEANRAVMGRAFVIYLRASVDDLWRRTKHDKNRPLLQTADPRAKLEALLQQRDSLYREVASLEVDTGRQPVNWVVQTILQSIEALDAGRQTNE